MDKIEEKRKIIKDIASKVNNANIKKELFALNRFLLSISTQLFLYKIIVLISIVACIATYTHVGYYKQRCEKKEFEVKNLLIKNSILKKQINNAEK